MRRNIAPVREVLKHSDSIWAGPGGYYIIFGTLRLTYHYDEYCPEANALELTTDANIIFPDTLLSAEVGHPKGNARLLAM